MPRAADRVKAEAACGIASRRDCGQGSARFPPNRDIPELDVARTAVVAEACTAEALIRAVKAGRSLVEGGGRLLGDPDLVRELEAVGYWAARRAGQERRDRLSLEAVGDGELIATAPCALEVEPGAGDGAIVRVLDAPDHAQTFTWRRGDGALRIDRVPHLFDRKSIPRPAKSGTASTAAPWHR